MFGVWQLLQLVFTALNANDKDEKIKPVLDRGTNKELHVTLSSIHNKIVLS